MSIENEFESLLINSDRLRPGFSSSLGVSDGTEVNTLELLIGKKMPILFGAIYARVLGTKRNLEKQIFFDFIPGYRLIHFEDIPPLMGRFLGFSQDSNWFIPLFENYSSDYVLFNYDNDGNSLGVYKYNHDMDSPELICDYDFKYLKMLNEFYNNGVFFCDSDGFLDYDFDLEGAIGLRFNPNIPYWN